MATFQKKWRWQLKKLFEDFQSAIRETVNIDEALELAQAYGNLLWFADVGIHDAPEVEVDLIERCARSLDVDAQQCATGGTSVLHVITEPLLTGGHTRLMERLAEMQGSPTDVLITRRISPEALDHVSSFFQNTLILVSSRLDEALMEMVALLCRYQKIVLHINPDDIMAVVACGIAKRRCSLEVFFVNHADHVFSYGTSVADYYFELSGHGRRFDQTKTIAGRKSFLGIPVNTREAKKASDFCPSPSAPLLFVSAGSDIKFKPRKGASIFDLVARILKDYPKSVFLIIGTDIKTSFWWWPMKLKYPSRLHIKSHLNFKAYGELVRNADYYVDSHPVPGATAFAEQFIKGLRCVGLLAPLQGYSQADRLKRPDVEGVMETIANYRYAQEVFFAIERDNSFESVKHRYLKCLYEGEVADNPFDESSGWPESTRFFENIGRSLKVDVSLDAFRVFVKQQRGLSIRLFKALSFSKKLKLLVKALLARGRQ